MFQTGVNQLVTLSLSHSHTLITTSTLEHTRWMCKYACVRKGVVTQPKMRTNNSYIPYLATINKLWAWQYEFALQALVKCFWIGDSPRNEGMWRTTIHSDSFIIFFGWVLKLDSGFFTKTLNIKSIARCRMSNPSNVQMTMYECKLRKRILRQSNIARDVRYYNRLGTRIFVIEISLNSILIFGYIDSTTNGNGCQYSLRLLP